MLTASGVEDQRLAMSGSQGVLVSLSKTAMASFTWKDVYRSRPLVEISLVPS